MSMAKAIRTDKWNLTAKESGAFMFVSSSGWRCVIKTNHFILFYNGATECRYTWSDPEGQIAIRKVVG